MLLAVVSIILSPQPSLFSYVWNKATEKVNDLLQKSAAFTFILKNIRNKQPTQFFLSSHLRHLMGSYLLPFLLSISKFIYFVSSPPIKCAELSSLYRRHHKACQATTPPTFCWNILKNAAGILNHSNPKSAPSLCCTKCAQVEHLVLDDSRCIWYLYHQQLPVKYYINREKCQRPDYFFLKGYNKIFSTVINIGEQLFMLESKYDQYQRVSGFHWHREGDLGTGCLLFPFGLKLLQKQEYLSSTGLFLKVSCISLNLPQKTL